jgi:hypothetical protein
MLEGLFHQLFLSASNKVMRRLWPFRPPDEVPHEEVERLKTEYRGTELAAILPFFALVLLTTPVLTIAIYAIQRLRDKLMPAHPFLVHPVEPDWLLWAVPGVFLAFITAGWLTTFLMWLLMSPDSFRDYEIAIGARHGIDNRRAGFWLTLSVVLSAGGVTLVLMDWYTRFEEDRICINRFWSFGEKVFRYDQVRLLVEYTHSVAPNGNVVQRPRQAVIFQDGTRWDRDDQVTDPQPLLAFLSRKTGKRILRAQFLEDVVRP